MIVEEQEVGLHERTSSSIRKSAEVFRENGHEQAIDEAFRELDLNNDGTLTRSEIQAFMTAAAAHVNLKVEQEVIDAAVDALIEDTGGDDENEAITQSQFVDIFRRHPDMLTVFKDEESVASLKLTVRSMQFTPKEIREMESENEEVWEHAHTAWKNKRVSYIWLALYFASNILAFTFKAVKYAGDDEATEVFGNCIIVARGAAQTLNLNACLILLPMCRHFLTRLRATRLRFLFPFDAVLEFHILVGAMIALFSTAHVAAHICDFHRFAGADEDDILALFGDDLGTSIPDSRGDRWKLLLRQRAGITGIIMVVCMLVAYPTTFSRRKNFNTFWYTHHLLLVMLIALCIHGTGSLLEPYQSVYWICGPLALYFVPRLFRETKCASVNIIDANTKEGNVVTLRLEKPSSWNDYVQAGMYAFLNVPQVSRWEWHPFTLTSSPADPYIEFNFRRSGDWTEKVHDLFEEIDGTDECSLPVVRVEGPIGASSQGFSDYPVVVLVGAGIGITPMISVLRTLLENPGKMRRTFFYWTVRDRSSFEWFSSLMDDIFDSDQKNVLQIRHFLTSVKQDDRDLGAVLLHHATRALHKKTNIDLLLGRHTHHQVEVGRPDWDEELSSVQEEAKQLGFKDCGIFFCGAEKMACAVRDTSLKFSRDDRDFHFYFTKETF